jgi:hypothetical protein
MSSIIVPRIFPEGQARRFAIRHRAGIVRRRCLSLAAMEINTAATNAGRRADGYANPRGRGAAVARDRKVNITDLKSSPLSNFP